MKKMTMMKKIISMARKNHHAKLQEFPKRYVGVFAALEEYHSVPGLLPPVDMGGKDLRQSSSNSLLRHYWASLAAQEFEISQLS